MGQEDERNQSSENGKTESKGEAGKNEENILKFLDSLDSYLILMNHLSSTLREGWLDLASARHSMGTSRISSALFDLKIHNAATSLLVNQEDLSSMEPAQFTLHKWVSHNQEDGCSVESQLEDKELSLSKSDIPQLRHRSKPQISELEEQKSENEGSSPSSVDQGQKERLRSLSMFGTLVSPKLRSAQLSFETALDLLVEIANMRATLLCAYDQVSKGMRNTEE